MNRTQYWPIAIITRTALGTAILLMAIAIFIVLDRTAPEPDPSTNIAPSTRVDVFKAKQILVSRQWRGYGTAKAMDTVDVTARVTTPIDTIAPTVLVGNPVRAGQLLMELDDSDFRRKVEIDQQFLADLNAQIALLRVERKHLTHRLALENDDIDLATQEWQRVEDLFKRNAATQKGLDAAKRSIIAAERTHLLTVEQFDKLPLRKTQLEAQHTAQQASLDLANQTLQRCRITSPIDGIIQAIDVVKGENVTSGMRVARVVNLARIEVALRLPAAARNDVSINDAVLLTATNRRDFVCTGGVSRIAPDNEVATRTLTVYVEIHQIEASKRFGEGDKTAIMLVPGTFFSGILTVEPREKRWVVPARAVRNSRLLTVDPMEAGQGQVRSLLVQVDYAIENEIASFGLPDDQWLVLHENQSGIDPDQLIVINTTAPLVDGDIVAPKMLSNRNPTVERETVP